MAITIPSFAARQQTDRLRLWYITNDGQISWPEFAYTIAERLNLNTNLVKPVPLKDFGYKARRPLYSVLSNKRGKMLPSLDNAMDRCIAAINEA